MSPVPGELVEPLSVQPAIATLPAAIVVNTVRRVVEGVA
jgi:hypothetical protein